MMRIFNITHIKAMALVAIAFVLSVSGFESRADNSFLTPDFAFPHTVIDNAEVHLSPSATDCEVVKAVIQLTIARNRISNDNVKSTLALIDSLAPTRNLATASVLYSFKAELLTACYSNLRPSQRPVVAAGSLPDDINEWTREDFASQVLESVTRSLENRDALIASPISDWSEVLTNYDASHPQFCPNLYALLSFRACDYLSELKSSSGVIPFYEDPALLTDSSMGCALELQKVFDYLVDYARSTSNQALMSQTVDKFYANRNLSPELYDEWLIGEYKSMPSAPESAEFLIIAASKLPNVELDADERERRYVELDELIAAQLSRYPDYFRNKQLNGLLASAHRDNMTVKLPKTQFGSDSDISAEVVKYNRVDPAYLLLFQDVSAFENCARGGYPTPDVHLLRAIPIQANSRRYITETDTISIGQLPYGNYIILASATDNLAAADSKNLDFRDYGSCIRFTVSDLMPLSLISAANSSGNNYRRLYALDYHNGKPIADTGIELCNRPGRNKTAKILKYETNAQGFLDLPESLSRLNLRFIRGADKYSTGRCDASSDFRKNSKSVQTVNLFTNLSLYHPGDTVKFSLFVAEATVRERRLVADRRLRVDLYNASSVLVDTLRVTTDAQGRAQGSFCLPKSGMLGSYRLAVKDADGPRSWLSNTYINVAEFVAPTFYVELQANKRSYKFGEPVRLSGEVKTYSGVPLSDAQVTLNLSYQSRINRFRGLAINSQDSKYSVKVSSDADGSFSLDLPTDNLPQEIFSAGLFTVQATATSLAGESQASDMVDFRLGKNTTLTLSVPPLIDAEEGPVTLTAKVAGVDYDAPAPSQVGKTAATLSYTLTSTATGLVVASGSFVSPSLQPDCTAFPSGEYLWQVALQGDEDVKASAKFILYRGSDPVPPVSSALWVPKKEVVLPIGSTKASVRVGSSYADSYVMCVVSNSDEVLSAQVLSISRECRNVSVPVPSGFDAVKVSLLTLRDGQYYSEDVQVQRAEALMPLETEVVSFRDKIYADTPQRWSFRYKVGGVPQVNMPVIATLSNKALNAISPFAWNYRLNRPTHYLYRLNYETNSRLRLSFSSPRGDYDYYATGYQLPDLNEYSSPLMAYYVRSERLLYASAAPRTLATMNAVALSGSAMATDATAELAECEDAADSGVEVADADLPADDASSAFRDSECSSAFFMPSLLTDGTGEVELSFTAPNFNTTWQLQLMGVTEDARFGHLIRDVEASKPVMVQSSLPRFVRTGDNMQLRFTAFNNSDSAADIMVRVLIFNPLTGDVIFSHEYEPHALAANAAEVVEADFTAPSDMEFVGVRVEATNGTFRDGEQSLLAVLPAAEPVTESTPFFLNPDATSFTITLPPDRAGSTAWVQYCDNPIWTCITALPDVMAESGASIYAKVHSYYGKAIAAGLVGRYPQAAEALRLWSETGDSTLISPLQRYGELKIADLGNTPWTLNATSESLRMSRLVSLLDTTSTADALSSALQDICSRQLSCGGWSWCPSMPASTFVTENLLLYFGMLEKMNFDNVGLIPEKNIAKAVSWCDAEHYNYYSTHKKELSALSLLDYLYVRSNFSSLTATRQFAQLKALALSKIKAGWRKLDIYDEATAAILLYREGYAMEARTILESLRQLASRSDDKGVWFDNLSSSWRGRNKLITTMQVLEAFAEISPADPLVDGLRQWLLIQRQAQDWGNNSEVSEVVYAILTSGSDWTADYAPATLTLAGEPLDISAADRLTGNVTIPLSEEQISRGGQLAISKSQGHQSWGGVVSRYMAEPSQVAAYSAGDITIEKRLLICTDEAGAPKFEAAKAGDLLPIGAKVKVQLIITSKRDMDYVAVNDSRSATLSPVEQLSAYTSQDGVWYYREVRNEATNLYFYSLPKGTLMIDYDCYVSHTGRFSLGVATAQSLYAPLQSAHTAGSTLSVGQ